jgi:Domain of unknown function (DUF4157)
MDSGTRGSMESRFGHDFSQVRVHNDAAAADSAHDVGARAYTVGQDVVFAHGHYAPHTPEGQHLLAHELAHTLQQRGLQRAPSHISSDQGAEYQHLEREAESAAASAMRGGPVPMIPHAGRPTLSRKMDDGGIVDHSATAKKPTSITVTSSAMTTTHTVKALDAFARTEDNRAKSVRKVESYEVDQLVVPASKGPNALAAYQALAGKSLEATLNVDGNTKAVLWQERADTGGLQSRWLKGVGWPGGKAADSLWQKCGGDSVFPRVGNETCQMDHIIELQVGGDNTEQNIQALDPQQNRESGGAIKNEVFMLAQKIREEPKLSDKSAEQMNLKFMSVKLNGTPEPLPSKCPPKKPTCLSVEACARQMQPGAAAAPAAAVPVVDYDISAGGRERVLKVPSTFAKDKKGKVAIKDDSLNNAAAEIIPGLLLNVLDHAGAGDEIDGEIDTREKTRLPITLEGKKGAVKFHVDKKGALKLANKTPNLAFTYRYLSPGMITSVSLNDEGGLDWSGHITPGVPFLGRLDVAYAKGELRVTKGLDEATLKKRSFLGAKITRAEIGIVLSPEFKPEGVLEFHIGPDKAPLVVGTLTIGKDDVGLVASGKLNLKIPKIDTAETDITYRAGGGRNEWDATIKVETSQIKLPYVKSGSLEGHIGKNGIDFKGKVGLELPGGTAEVGLQRYGNEWIFSGSGTFRIPKLDETHVAVTYNTGTEHLVATGSTGFTIHSIGLSGKLDKVTVSAKRGEPAKVSGTGSMEIKKGKASGSATVTLHENGKFSGKGRVDYQFTENIKAGAEVELDEKEKLRITGELTIARFKLFDGFHDSKELFNLDITIPIPGASVGGIGLNAVIGGGVEAGYDIGPGVIEPLTFEAGFDPLEADPNLDLKVSGQLKIPAAAHLSANIHGAVEISIGVASLQGGLQLTGTVKLEGGVFGKFDARYNNKKLEAHFTPEISAELKLAIALSAFVIAKAGIGWLSVKTRKDWLLAQKEIATGLRFSLSAPISYSTDTGVKLPTMDEVVLKKPDIDAGDLLRKVFGSADSKEADAD